MTAAVEVLPATADRFDLVAHALTGGGDGASCWCRWLLETRRAFDAATREERRTLLVRELEDAAVAPGLVLTVDGAAAGWVRVGPRVAQPGVLRTRVVRGGGAEPADDPEVWAVTCFVVRREHRGTGVAAALLDAAVGHAFAHGARVVEGYPVDRAARPGATSAELWHGTAGLFVRAGFVETARPTPARPVMTLRP
ncbi:GNAT family N-acetyltransferase [Amnibacterium setariae]|uniref:GNAT family N-acetyltransferase n=1 Tax=Amnibacterium setariae TaxID=2306585 RepID=A0A3A1U0P3_9MICO|nr:GNAT family N-acetyltransferase [Amnibacterium setariae]RIX30042.1 GNAT family N-acetyltransferase [Amnibacterium setariae]